MWFVLLPQMDNTISVFMGEHVGYSTDYDSCGASIWGCFIVGLFKRTSTEDKLVTKLKIRMWL